MHEANADDQRIQHGLKDQIRMIGGCMLSLGACGGFCHKSKSPVRAYLLRSCILCLEISSMDHYEEQMETIKMSLSL